MNVNTEYMYKNQYCDQYFDLDRREYCIDRELKVVHIKNATILPAKRDPDRFWGAGGALDENGAYVKESQIRCAFGKAYNLKPEEEIKKIDEDVIYIPCIPNHWGHFLLDVVSRLWFTLENSSRIAFCISGFSDGRLIPNMQEFLELLKGDYGEEQFIIVDKPMRFRSVMIPEPSLLQDNEWYFHLKYLETIEKVKNGVLASKRYESFKKYQKIYFTRTRLETNRHSETGEKIIEETFRRNGFQVFSPELLSLSEQIFLISNCKEMASLSGTIPHNIVFANRDIHLIILSRTACPNSLQVMFNHMTGVDYTIIDVYHKVKKPNPYGVGPFWVEYNNNLKRYIIEHWENIELPGRGSIIMSRIVGRAHYCIALGRKKLKTKLKKIQLLRKLYNKLRYR